ncbi:MAG: hypothetical protein QF562_02215 [Verrucomicrobiota bacterium]|nr:hypothetical protein [Verrucomicrobiota bacterium]
MSPNAACNERNLFRSAKRRERGALGQALGWTLTCVVLRGAQNPAKA